MNDFIRWLLGSRSPSGNIDVSRMTDPRPISPSSRPRSVTVQPALDPDEDARNAAVVRQMRQGAFPRVRDQVDRTVVLPDIPIAGTPPTPPTQVGRFNVVPPRPDQQITMPPMPIGAGPKQRVGPTMSTGALQQLATGPVTVHPGSGPGAQAGTDAVNDLIARLQDKIREEGGGKRSKDLEALIRQLLNMAERT